MATKATPVKNGMNIPGTFEVYNTVTGRWQGTYTEFKTAEATADLLNSETQGEAHYTWRWVR